MNGLTLKKNIEYIFMKNTNYEKHTYLGIFSIKEFNNLDLRYTNNCCLIIFIDGIKKNLGHWLVICKIKKDLYWIDSFGLSPLFYKNNINNKYLKFSYYLSKRLQSRLTTICGGYCIFFIHMIFKSNYNIKQFKTILINNFHFKNFEKNDQIIAKYILNNTLISKNKCKKYFCSTKFIINYHKCTEIVCADKD